MWPTASSGPLAGLAAGAAVLLAACTAGHGGPPRRLPSSARRAPARRAPHWFVEACRQLHWSGPPDEAWFVTRAATALAATAVLLVWGPAAAVVVGAVFLAAPRAVAPILQRRRLAERDRQLPDAMERIAAAVRAGSLPGPALVETSAHVAPPLRDELAQAAARLRQGDALSTALRRWAAHPDSSQAVVLATSALELGSHAGGEVARALDGVAATLRERRQAQAEVRALATQARTSAWLLAAAPLAFAALVATVEPGVVQFLFATPLGVGCLLAGVLLDALGVAWMARIVGAAS